mmetsp:Transcript_17523/g.52714  ORF Transcript_17523/g.52714 Transcript_17523/m.52714 type:complete len:282 (+) Transcript_17523:41-886(+)
MGGCNSLIQQEMAQRCRLADVDRASACAPPRNDIAGATGASAADDGRRLHLPPLREVNCPVGERSTRRRCVLSFFPSQVLRRVEGGGVHVEAVVALSRETASVDHVATAHVVPAAAVAAHASQGARQAAAAGACRLRRVRVGAVRGGVVEHEGCDQGDVVGRPRARRQRGLLLQLGLVVDLGDRQHGQRVGGEPDVVQRALEVLGVVGVLRLAAVAGLVGRRHAHVVAELQVGLLQESARVGPKVLVGRLHRSSTQVLVDCGIWRRIEVAADEQRHCRGGA